MSWTRDRLKTNGKIAFKKNYWSCVAVAVIMGIITGLSGEWRKSRRQCFAEQFVWNRWIWISVCRIGDYNDSNYSDSHNSSTGDICGKSSRSRRKKVLCSQ